MRSLESCRSDALVIVWAAQWRSLLQKEPRLNFGNWLDGIETGPGNLLQVELGALRQRLGLGSIEARFGNYPLQYQDGHFATVWMALRRSVGGCCNGTKLELA